VIVARYGTDMAKRVTISAVYDALLQLARAVEEYARKTDARWDANHSRRDEDDARWNQNAQALSTIERRLTNLEDYQSAFRAEMHGGFGRMSERFDRLERRIAAVER